MKPIRVMIVDDHEVVRMGLRAALEPEDDMEVVAESGDAQFAIEEAQIARPAVVLMDVRMPGTDGIRACRMLREQLPETKVVMLTSYGDEQAVIASIMAGAVGYLLKNTQRADLLSAVRTVARGESLLDPSVAGQVLSVLRDLAAKEQSREAALLSQREREVLGLMAQGLTNKEIAQRLVISEHTVRNHVSSVLDKLDVTSRSGAVAKAIQRGLLDSDPPTDG